MTHRYLDKSSSSLSCICSHFFPLFLCLQGSDKNCKAYLKYHLRQPPPYHSGSVPTGSHQNVLLTSIIWHFSYHSVSYPVYCEHTEDTAWVFRFSLAQACFGILLCLEEVPSKCERIGLSGAESNCETLRSSLPVLDSPWYTSSLLSPNNEWAEPGPRGLPVKNDLSVGLKDTWVCVAIGSTLQGFH